MAASTGVLQWVVKHREIVAAVVVIAGGWGTLYWIFNDRVEYSTTTTPHTHLSLAFDKMDTEAEKYCGGGWDWLRRIVTFRSCYDIAFRPADLKHLTVCTPARGMLTHASSSPVEALRAFERDFEGEDCFEVQAMGRDYQVTPGARAAPLDIAVEGSVRRQYFCGCDNSQIADAVERMRGRVLPLK